MQAARRLVPLAVVVHQKSGHPVHDLTRDDFVIAESGKLCAAYAHRTRRAINRETR